MDSGDGFETFAVSLPFLEAERLGLVLVGDPKLLDEGYVDRGEAPGFADLLERHVVLNHERPNALQRGVTQARTNFGQGDDDLVLRCVLRTPFVSDGWIIPGSLIMSMATLGFSLSFIDRVNTGLAKGLSSAYL